MIDERERYERAFQQFQMPEPAWDRLVDRRDRKRRNQRITAGVVVGGEVVVREPSFQHVWPREAGLRNWLHPVVRSLEQLLATTSKRWRAN